MKPQPNGAGLTPADLTAAACRGLDPDLWHPPDGGNGKAAKAICKSCPIREACLTASVARGERYGVWGGAGEQARRKLRTSWLVGGPVWSMAVAEHFEALDAGRSSDVNGASVTHGRRGAYAKGCRCGPCSLAAVMGDDVLAKIGKAA